VVDALRRHWLPVGVAAAIVFLALKGGAYALSMRSPTAIVVWLAIAAGLGALALPRVRPPRAALVVGGVFASFAALHALSAAWGDSTENAVLEFDRVALYLGIFTLVVLVAREASARRWSEGIAIGIAGVGVLALSYRLFPELFGPSGIDKLNPGDPRLSYPVNYWNGLSALVALGLPLLVRSAVDAGSARSAALWIAPVPALVTTMYLTSSRGGAAVAILGLAVFVALTNRRPRALAATAVGLAGAAVAVACVQAQGELVNGPLNSAAVPGQGRMAALLVAVACAATAVAWALLRSRVPDRIGLSSAVKRAAVAFGVVVAIAGVAAADPASRFEDLKRPPETVDANYVKSHILSSGGNGRWQFWSAAVDEFESAPLVGGGAGSYAAWWAEHGTLAYFTRNAHSLFLETMGELGLVGLLLLLGVIGVGFVVAVGRLRAAPDEERPVVAALFGTFCGFVLAAATDWAWDLTVLTVIGVACLALLVGPATVFAPVGRERSSSAVSRRAWGWRAVAVAAVLALVVAQAVPYLTERRVRDSQAALRAGDADRALSLAQEARDSQPWAASAYLQIGLVQEYDGDLVLARESVGKAIDRDPSDWQLWAVASRIDEARGDLPAARSSFDRARELNPRSVLFTAAQRP
jgi:hypothetical protein